MKYFLFALVTLVSCFSIVSAQTNHAEVGVVDINSDFTNPNFMIKEKPFASKLEGSQMLFQEELSGYVVPKSGIRTKQLKINYNLVMKQTIITMKGDVFSIQDRHLDSLVITNKNKETVYLFGEEKDKSEILLLEVLVDGMYPLLKSTKASLVRPDYNPILMTGNKNTSIKKIDFYYVLDSGNFIMLPNKATKVLTSDSYSLTFKNLVKKSNPKMKNEKDLKKLFIRINDV